MEILGVGSERALSRLCGLFPCRSLRPPIWGILLFDPGEPLPLSGPLASKPGARAPLGHPRRCHAVTRSPPGHTPSSRAAQVARWLLGAAHTLGFIFSLTFSEVPFFAGPSCRVCILGRPSRGPPQRGPPSGGHGPSTSQANRAPRAWGRGQSSGNTPVYWLNARAALRPPPPHGPESTERNAPRALCGARTPLARGAGPLPSWARPLVTIHTQMPATDQS